MEVQQHEQPQRTIRQRKCPVRRRHDRVLPDADHQVPSERRPTLLRELDHSIDVADFVVIPREHFDASAVDHHRGRPIDNRRARIVLEIDRHERQVLVAENARQRLFGRRTL